MKKRRRSPSPRKASGEVIRMRRCEIRSMVQAEVLSAVRQTEAQVERLLEKVQLLERETKYDFTVRKLEAHIKKVKRRGDAAIAYIQNLGITGTQDEQNQLVTALLDLPWSESEEETMETASPSNIKGQAVRNALFEVKNEPPSPSPISSATTPPSSPQHKRATQKPVELIKKELQSPDKSAEHDEQEEQEELGDEIIRVKVEPPQEEHEDELPSLPPTLFPSVLSAEAASYTIPQKPVLKLALIRDPPGLSVLWNVEDVDPAAPPMDSYSVFMAVERDKGSGVFPEWKRLGEIQAVPLPMCVMLSKYKPGYRACFSVVGKDKFGRYGPYSKVVAAKLPQDSA